MDTSDTIIDKLYRLGLGVGEAKLYLELLKNPTTHLRLAHATGINRTKVYRLIADLEKRSLVTRRTDDRGTFLVAADPATLEVDLVSREEKLKSQRAVFGQLMPLLEGLKTSGGNNFIVQTYEGVSGLKQMLWHELKTKGENLIFGCGAIENLVADRRWSEKHRAMTLEAGYRVREIVNYGDKPADFTKHKDFYDIYYVRAVAKTMLPLSNQMCVYNDTVAVYHWRQEQKVGVEVINRPYAEIMRHIFEHYWRLAKPYRKRRQAK